MSDYQRYQVMLDFSTDIIPRSGRNDFKHDYSKHELIEVTFPNGQIKRIPLGALVGMAQSKNYRIILLDGVLTAIYFLNVNRDEKTWDKYTTAIDELNSQGINFRLTSILYPWQTFKAECIRQFLNKKLNYTDLREALK